MRSEHRPEARAHTSPMSTSTRDPQRLYAEADRALQRYAARHASNFEDMRQEYVTLRLEGFTPEQARYRCRTGQNSTSAIERGTGLGNVAPGSVFDYLQERGDRPSLTMDGRSDADREESWERSETLRSAVAAMSPSVRQVMEMRYGLVTGEPMTPEAVARETGLSFSAVTERITKGRKALRQVAA